MQIIENSVLIENNVIIIWFGIHNNFGIDVWYGYNS